MMQAAAKTVVPQKDIPPKIEIAQHGTSKMREFPAGILVTEVHCG
ncbi:hypothetical protein QRQ56_22905 [Bradyrhizobium sp. U531]